MAPGIDRSGRGSHLVCTPSQMISPCAGLPESRRYFAFDPWLAEENDPQPAGCFEADMARTNSVEGAALSCALRF
jgi:hypothetical protein